MENLTTNKKIGLGCAIALVISGFLPYITIGPITASLMDVAGTSDGSLYLFPLLGIVAAILTFKDKVKVARILFLVSLLLWLLITFSGVLGLEIFKVAGIGLYLLISSSVVGIIFSKE